MKKLELIKKELEYINERNKSFNLSFHDVTNLTEALNIAVDFIKSCTPDENGDTCHEHTGDVAHDAHDSAKRIADVLIPHRRVE